VRGIFVAINQFSAEGFSLHEINGKYAPRYQQIAAANLMEQFVSVLITVPRIEGEKPRKAEKGLASRSPS